MSASARKPWPLRWVVATILLFIVPYTFLTLKYRKPGRAFEPYADLKAQANVKRLLDAGYVRVSLHAERPFPPLRAAAIAPGTLARTEPAPAGLPDALNHTLVETPSLPLAYRDLLTPAELTHTEPARLQFTASFSDEHTQPAGADLYVRDNNIIIVPTFEPVPGGLTARTRETNLLLTLPASLLAPGRHEVTLLGTRSSLRWTWLVR
jgi:hypothetical protein